MAKNISITYKGDDPMRVNKFLALESVCSRREAEALISSGAISIDGHSVVDLGHKISKGETLTLNKTGQQSLSTKQTFVVNKPEGYVSAQPEDGQVPAARLLVPSKRYYGNHQPPEGAQFNMPSKTKPYAPLGRLDQDSRGLLILSEDGVLAKAIIGENSPLEKDYRVKVLGEITDEKIQLLRHGLELDDKPLKPVEVENPYKNVLAITLREGRNRQIRRMCEAVDLKVLDLVRLRVGPIRLRDLPEGEWRPLSKKERQAALAGQNSLPRTLPQKMTKPEEREERSFAPRVKSFDKKPIEKRPFEKKSFDKKPFDKKPGGRRSFDDTASDKRSDSDSERSFDRKPSRKPFEGKFSDRKSSGDKPYDRSDSDKKPYDKKPSGGKSFGQKSFDRKPSGKSFGGKSFKKPTSRPN